MEKRKNTKGRQGFAVVAMALTAITGLIPLTIFFGVLLIVYKMQESKA